MITTVKINKEIKIQKCEHNGIKFYFNPKHEHKTIVIKLNEREIELLFFIITIILDNQD